MPVMLKEPMQRQELTLSKLASVCSLTEEATHKILLTMGKGVAHFSNLISLNFMRQENM